MEENSKKEPTKNKAALQILLPLFPAEATLINSMIAVQRRAETVYYFNGSMPMFMHNEHEIDSFRYITSQLLANGCCRKTFSIALE